MYQISLYKRSSQVKYFIQIIFRVPTKVCIDFLKSLLYVEKSYNFFGKTKIGPEIDLVYVQKILIRRK
jgi:hypothetical protein